jgi:hypothetical protein
VAFYTTSETNASLAHVWVTLNSVSLVKGTASTTVYDPGASGGQLVDLSAMHDGGGNIFLFLGSETVNTSGVTAVSLVVNSQASVILAGASSAVNATFAGSSGPTFTMTLPIPANAPSVSGGIVIDFNLANWTLSGATLSAKSNQFLSLGTPSAPRSGGHFMANDYVGIVGTLSGAAPNQTFTFNQSAFTTSFSTSSATSIYNADGSSNPVLADGDAVVVHGTFNSGTGVVQAQEIAIFKTGLSQPTPFVHGLVTADSATAGSITLALENAIGCQPTVVNFTVNTTSSTTFLDASGVSESASDFFASLTTGTSEIAASGDVKDGAMTATAVKLVGMGKTSPTPELAFFGAVTDPNAKAGTFNLNVSDWQGWNWGAPKSVNVTTGNTTTYEVNGAKVSEAAFFAAITSTTIVEVKGAFNVSTSTLAADRVRIGNNH